MIQKKLAKGVYLKDIAAELGVHPRTVRRAMARGGAPSGKRPRARRSKLDAFKPAVDRLLSVGGVEVVILWELRSRGYAGGVTANGRAGWYSLFAEIRSF